MKLPKYTDDEVKVFHPVFEFSFKPIFLDNKFFERIMNWFIIEK